MPVLRVPLSYWQMLVLLSDSILQGAGPHSSSGGGLDLDCTVGQLWPQDTWQETSFGLCSVRLSQDCAEWEDGGSRLLGSGLGHVLGIVFKKKSHLGFEY